MTNAATRLWPVRDGVGRRVRAEAKTLGRGFNPSRGPSSGYLDWNPWGVSNPFFLTSS